MSESTLQGRMNAMKEGVLNLLKKKGSYIEHCPKQGFIYRYIGSIAEVVGKDLADKFGEIVDLAIGFRDGTLYLLAIKKIA
ncbi:hypothetical protein MKZ20_21655 [Psychrobacillus sp. FSL K6-2684]|uniref:hypothetical protein n=1 Tax=unclassified Psychrobacillus TaxID=2636677 RepID=UPI0030FCB9B5